MKAVIAVMLLIAMVAMSGMAAAVVEEGWPMGTPNTYNGTHILVDFEDGHSWQTITYPTDEIVFENDGLYSWIYGCNDCGDFSIYPDGLYAINGNCGAWCNIPGHYGNISFKHGVGHVSVLVATASGLTMDAYNKKGEQVTTSGWAEYNLDTGMFTRLSVDRPQCDISHVCIHDTGNYWVIDDLVVGIGHGQSEWAHCQRFIHSNGQEHWNVPPHVAERWDPCDE